MESLLHDAARIVVFSAEAIALLLIAIGIVEVLDREVEQTRRSQQGKSALCGADAG